MTLTAGIHQAETTGVVRLKPLKGKKWYNETGRARASSLACNSSMSIDITSPLLSLDSLIIMLVLKVKNYILAIAFKLNL